MVEHFGKFSIINLNYCSAEKLDQTYLSVIDYYYLFAYCMSLFYTFYETAKLKTEAELAFVVQWQSDHRWYNLPAFAHQKLWSIFSYQCNERALWFLHLHNLSFCMHTSGSEHSCVVSLVYFRQRQRVKLWCFPSCFGSSSLLCRSPPLSESHSQRQTNAVMIRSPLSRSAGSTQRGPGTELHCLSPSMCLKRRILSVSVSVSRTGSRWIMEHEAVVSARMSVFCQNTNKCGASFCAG